MRLDTRNKESEWCTVSDGMWKKDWVPLITAAVCYVIHDFSVETTKLLIQ